MSNKTEEQYEQEIAELLSYQSQMSDWLKERDKQIKDYQAEIIGLRGENERLKEAQKWIPVSERLPNIGETVICKVENNAFLRPLTLLINGKLNYYWDMHNSDYFAFHKITHWKALPTPPND